MKIILHKSLVAAVTEI